MKDIERRFSRVQPPDVSVPSHRAALKMTLQSGRIHSRPARRTLTTLSLVALVMLGGLTLGYPGWAKDLMKTAFVQTITLHTHDGHTVMIKKVQTNDGVCPAICDTSACDSSWSTPDGRRFFRKQIRAGSSAEGSLHMMMACADTSRLTDLLRTGVSVPGPAGETFQISNPDGDSIWVVNGDTVDVLNRTVSAGEAAAMNTLPGERAADNVAPAGPNADFELLQNYPNPFNPTTQISFDLAQSGVVTLKVFNVVGQEVATLINGNANAGRHTVTFDGTNLPSGTYTYTLRAAGSQVSRMMMLAK